MSNNYMIQSVERAFDIIDYMYEHGGSASIQEISQDLDLYQSTVHRMLNTMKYKNYVTQSKPDLRYHLGPRFLAIGSYMRASMNLEEVFRKLSQHLIDTYGESVQLDIPDTAATDAPRMITILRFGSDSQVLGTVSRLGIPVLCHSSSCGKTLFAYSGSEYISQFRGCELKKFTQFTITDWNILDEELEHILKQGYAIDRNEHEIGLMGIAVPVFDMNDNICASISIQGPIERLELLSIEEVVRDLKSLAERFRPYTDLIQVN